MILPYLIYANLAFSILAYFGGNWQDFLSL